MKRIVLTALLSAWGVIAAVRTATKGVDIHTAYGVGALAGSLTAVLVAAYGLRRMWRGPAGRPSGVVAELRSHPLPYIIGAVLIVGAVALPAFVGPAETEGRPVGDLAARRAAATIRAGFVDGCSLRQPRSMCECMTEQLVDERGIDTRAEVEALGRELDKAARSGDPADVPAYFREATLDCTAS